jgi:hypothetical protein
VIVGDAKVGYTLRVVPGLWTPKPSFAYVWYANDVKISGATANEYTPTTTDVGKRITATTIGTASGFSTTARTSAKTAAVVAENVQLPEQPWTGKVVGSVYLDSVSPANLITDGSVSLVDVDYGWEDASVQIEGGTFDFSDVEVGEHTLRAYVEVAGEDIVQFYGQTTQLSAAQTFAVQADGTVRVDLIVKRGATISGTVTSGDGSAVTNALVYVHRVDGDEGDGDYDYTDYAGRFTVGGLEPGKYKTEFSAPSANPLGLIGEWYGNVDSEDSATSITVSQWGQTVLGINTVLDVGARMHGNVYDAGWNGIANAAVYLVPTTAAVQGFTPYSAQNVVTDQWGAFDISGLAPGDYYVHVTADRYSAPAYTSQWIGGTGTLATASVYRAARGTQMASVYAQLATSPSVTTTVTGLAAAGWDTDYTIVNLYQGGVVKYSGYAWNPSSAFIKDITPGTYQVAITYHRGTELKAYWWNGGTYADKSEIVVRAGDSISIVAKAITRVAPAGARLVR